MATDKAMYWLALGILSLGLSGAYQHGELCRVERLIARSSQAVERAAERGHDLVLMAEVIMGRSPAEIPGLEAVLDKVQAHAADLPSAVRDRELAGMQRDLAQLSRDLDVRQADLSRVHVRCPERRVVVDLSHLRIPTVVVPDIQIAPAEFGRIPDAEFRSLEGLRAIQVGDFSNLPGMDGHRGRVRVEIRKPKTAQPI